MTFDGFLLISQAADVVGTPGLGILNIGFTFLLLLLWRWKVQGMPVPAAFLRASVVVYALLWVTVLAYGLWRTADLEADWTGGKEPGPGVDPAELSLMRLASNPAMAFSQREKNLGGLLSDSSRALEQFSGSHGVPRLVIWPESTYPAPYYKYSEPREMVEWFVESHDTSVLLATTDWQETPEGERYYSLVLLIGPDGSIAGRYDKIFLIPFGEYIPLAEQLPGSPISCAETWRTSLSSSVAGSTLCWNSATVSGFPRPCALMPSLRPSSGTWSATVRIWSCSWPTWPGSGRAWPGTTCR